MERAAADATIAPEPSGGAPASPGGAPVSLGGTPAPTDLRAAMLHHKAMTLLQLHSPTSPPSSTSTSVTSTVGATSFCSSSASFLSRAMSAKTLQSRFLLIGPEWTASSSPGSSPRSRMIWARSSMLRALQPGTPGLLSSRNFSATARLAPFSWRRGFATLSKATSPSPSTAARGNRLQRRARHQGSG